MYQSLQHTEHALPSATPSASQGWAQFSLRTLFFVTTLLAILFGLTQSLGIVSTAIVAAFALWLSATLFLLRFACTTWFLFAVGILLVLVSATYTHTTVAVFLMAAALAIWPFAQLLIVASRQTVKRRAVHWQVYAFVAFLLIVASMLLTHWPLRVSFAISRPALTRLAAEARGGQAISRPHRAGLFLIRSSEITADGVVCLWTQPHPSGKTGFVQCTAARAKHFNLWSMLQLSADWQLVSED